MTKKTISELVEKLEEMKEKHGDIPVGYYNDGRPFHVNRVHFTSGRNTGENDFSTAVLYFDEDSVLLE